MKFVGIPILLPDGTTRLSLRVVTGFEQSEEMYYAIVSAFFVQMNWDNIKYHWEQTGQKPYGFITEDTKAL